jgi:hypothetical protein
MPTQERGHEILIEENKKTRSFTPYPKTMIKNWGQTPISIALAGAPSAPAIFNGKQYRV